MKQLWLIGLCAFALNANGQNLYGPTNDSMYLGFFRDSIAVLERPTLMIVPFNPKFYRSEIDQDITKGTNYTFEHTRGFFRKGLDNAILIAAKEYNDYVSMHADDGAVNMDLHFIYKVVFADIVPYEPPVIQSEKGFKKRLADYWVKLQTNVAPAAEPGTRIKEGQLHTVSDNRELITKTGIYNPILFDSLQPKYKADYYIFVNELDLLYGMQTQQQYESDNYKRLIKVHYSVYDKEGNALFSLIKKRPCSSNKNDVPAIITDEILPLGHEVIYSLDSYRFLKAGLHPYTEQELEVRKKKRAGNSSPLQKIRQ